jgi:hypothetical protein
MALTLGIGLATVQTINPEMGVFFPLASRSGNARTASLGRMRIYLAGRSRRQIGAPGHIGEGAEAAHGAARNHNAVGPALRR